jgi:DNA-binding transcriptional MerR regulator
MKRRTYQVNEVARLAGVSVRTLHHYDAVGLLVPSGRTDSGYRLYDDDALLRLQQIIIGRELGLPLEKIRCALDDPTFDRRRALLEQRSQLEARRSHAVRMIGAIDRALAVIDGKQSEQEGNAMNVNMKEIFDGFDSSQHEAEATQRWGDTDGYAESMKRTKSYTKEDWERLRDDQASIYGDAVAAMKAGKKPEDEAVMDIAERHRLSIDRWFYPCSYAKHRGLASMYEADERFAQNIDKYGEGLTVFLSAAIRANAARNGA